MKTYIISAFIVFSTISCEKKMNNSLVKDPAADSLVVVESNEPIVSSTLQTCFLSVTDKDSLFVSLEDNLGTYIGKMRYKNSEKDSSFGDIIGTQNGDTIKINYTFQAEGTTSEKEIYFLKKDGNLIEGIGEHKVEGNKDFYANSAKLKYEGAILKQIDCQNFDKNFTSK